MTFIKGQMSLMKGKTKISGLYPKRCGFQVGHPKYTSVGDFKKGLVPHNAGSGKWLELKCLECGKEFKIRDCHNGRGRGKYCSRKCFTKAKTIYELTPDERFTYQLRQLDEYKKWHMDCLRKNWFECQICKSKEKLEVHHKKSFRELVIEFLQKYKQFSLIEDKETLVRLTFNYEPFWDIDNGITYCRKCHRSIEMKIRMEIKEKIWQ